MLAAASFVSFRSQSWWIKNGKNGKNGCKGANWSWFERTIVGAGRGR